MPVRTWPACMTIGHLVLCRGHPRDGHREGRKTSLAARRQASAARSRRAMLPFAVIGATALAAQGLPRMARELGVVVTTDDVWAAAIGALGRRHSAAKSRQPANAVPLPRCQAGGLSCAALVQSASALRPKIERLGTELESVSPRQRSLLEKRTLKRRGIRLNTLRISTAAPCAFDVLESLAAKRTTASPSTGTRRP